MNTRCLNKFRTGISRNVKKFVKVCLHSSKAVQISIQFDGFFYKKKSKFFFRGNENLTKSYPSKTY